MPAFSEKKKMPQHLTSRKNKLNIMKCPFTPIRAAKTQVRWHQVLIRMWKNWNSQIQLIGMEMVITTVRAVWHYLVKLEIHMSFSPAILSPGGCKDTLPCGPADRTIHGNRYRIIKCGNRPKRPVVGQRRNKLWRSIMQQWKQALVTCIISRTRSHEQW